jgi:hypothetical protein
MTNSLTPAALAQPNPISAQLPRNQQEWQQFATTLNQWLQYVAPAAFTGTIVTAKLTSGGTQGAQVFLNGTLIRETAAT